MRASTVRARMISAEAVFWAREERPSVLTAAVVAPLSPSTGESTAASGTESADRGCDDDRRGDDGDDDLRFPQGQRLPEDVDPPLREPRRLDGMLASAAWLANSLGPKSQFPCPQTRL